MAKHVLQFFSMLGSGGAENRMMDVYRCVNTDKLIFDFAVFHNDDCDFDEEITSLGSKKYIFPDPRKGIVKCYSAMVRFFKEHQEIKAVHAHVSWFSGVVLMAAKKAKIPYRIAHARDARNPSRGLIDSIFCNIGKVLIFFSATQRVAISYEAAENIFGRFAVKHKRFIYIPNSIDQKKYKYLSETEKKKVRDSLGIPTNCKAYVTVANLKEIKNHTYLIKIAFELKKIGHEFVLFLIGDGVLKAEIESQIKEMNLENNIILLGTRSDVPSILGAFDCMIFTSRSEGLGGVVLEAQLVGIPSVVSDRIPKVVDVGANMVTFISLEKSAREWAEKIIHVSNNFSENHEKTLRAFKEKGYCIEDTTSAYLKEYGFNPEEIKDIMK